jgi:hypothetical protein
MLSKFQALIAAETESSYLEDRWKVLPGADRGTTLLLEDLLDSQQRLADAEGEFVTSQVAYSIALIRVRRSMGTLLIAQNPTRYEGETVSPEPTLVPEENLVPPPQEAPELEESAPLTEENADKNNPLGKIFKSAFSGNPSQSPAYAPSRTSAKGRSWIRR